MSIIKKLDSALRKIALAPPTEVDKSTGNHAVIKSEKLDDGSVTANSKFAFSKASTEALGIIAELKLRQYDDFEVRSLFVHWKNRPLDDLWKGIYQLCNMGLLSKSTINNKYHLTELGVSITIVMRELPDIINIQ